MADVVITIPKTRWGHWISEGCLAGEGCPDDMSYYVRVWGVPDIRPGERVYVVAHGRLRGYAPLVCLEDSIPSMLGLDDTLQRWRDEDRDGFCYLLRRGGANAVTIPDEIRGFQGWRYRWWERDKEVPFPDWRTEGVEHG